MQKAGYLGYVHSFRGFAILNVVAIHALALAVLIPRNWKGDPASPISILSETLFHDSTIYFALISGLLFSSVLRARGYASFYRSKAMYVLLPYVFCTLVFSLMRFNEAGTGVLAWPADWSDYLDSIWPNLLFGKAQFTYWYLPVLLILFAFTPLLGLLAQAKSWAAVPIWLLMLAPLVFSRPDFGDGSDQIVAGTVIYFLGAYAVGVYVGNHLEALLDRIAPFRNPMIAAAVLSSALLIGLQYAQIDRFGSYSLQETIYYVQKLSLAGLVLLWLRGLENRQPRWLGYFANEAFSIYFLHIFFMLLLAELAWTLLHDPRFLPWSVYLSGLAFFVFALAMSMLTVWLMRRLLGRHSRLLIGS
ncbi:MAG: acyltransferase family protein [Lysobacterales bacterium]